MAHGYPDYWGPNQMGLPVPSVGQIPWHDAGGAFVASLAQAPIIDYAVAADEILFVTGGVVSCARPGSQRYDFMWNTPWEISQTIYYDIVGHFPLNPSVVIEVLAGERFIVRVENQSDVAENFYCTAFGIRVPIVQGAVAPVGEGILIRQAGF